MVRYYKDLFSEDQGFVENQEEAIRKNLESTSRVLIDADLRMLEKRPTKKELHTTLTKLSRGKSPGIDGLTTEVYLKCWYFIEDECFALVLHF